MGEGNNPSLPHLHLTGSILTGRVSALSAISVGYPLRRTGT